MRNYSVILEPVGENDGTENRAGLAVLLWDGEGQKFETSRVAFRRQASRSNKEVGFVDQLNVEIDKAQDAADRLNDFLDDFERKLAEDKLDTRDRIREIMGTPKTALQ